MTAFEGLDQAARRHAGLGVRWLVAIVIFLALLGAGIGLVLPKYEAVAMLQFPELPRGTEQARPFDTPRAAVDLVTYKRIASMYAAPNQLKVYFDTLSPRYAAAAARLLKQAEFPSFWEKVATPVLPFTRRDQREYGDIKDAAGTLLIGINMMTDARNEQLAEEMIDVLSGYLINAVMRERIRAWALAGLTDSAGSAKVLQADVLRAELDIQLSERRVLDMKSILVRFPDAARMDARQVVNVNPSEGGERFLSPLAQLVGFESTISQRREQIQRWQRDLKQKQLLAGFYAEAERVVDATTTVDKLIPALQDLAVKQFATADGGQEWAKEATLRVRGALDNFAVTKSQFGVRNGVHVSEVASRGPVRLSLLLALAGVVLIGGIVFLSASLRVVRSDRS
jgi:hypothetical protein